MARGVQRNHASISEGHQRVNRYTYWDRGRQQSNTGVEEMETRHVAVAVLYSSTVINKKVKKKKSEAYKQRPGFVPEAVSIRGRAAGICRHWQCVGLHEPRRGKPTIVINSARILMQSTTTASIVELYYCTEEIENNK